MSDTANGLLPLLSESQEQKWSTINDAMERISALLGAGAVDRLSAAPGAPADGAVYLITGGASGAWAGHDNELGLYINGGWVYFTPGTDFTIWVADEDRLYKYAGGSWTEALKALAYDDYTLASALGVQPGTVGAPGLFINGDSNTGLYQPAGADSLGVAIGGVRKAQFDAEGLIIGDDGPSADVTLGLVINQGGNDDGALALKSSDVAHTMTTLAEADTWFLARKVDGADGGASLEAYSTGSYALRFRGVPTAAPVFNSSFSFGAVMFDALESDGGTGTQAIGDGDVIAAFRNEFDTRAALMGNGDFWIGGGLQVGNGAVGTPSLAFSGDTDTGAYLVGTGILGLAAAGGNVLNVHAGKVGIGATTVPDGVLHVFGGTAGTVAASTDADELVVEASGDGGAHLLAPDANPINLRFGSPGDATGALIRYFYNGGSPTLGIGTSNASGQLILRSADGVEAARVDASQRMIVGHSSTIAVGGITGELQVHTATSGGLTITRWSTNQNGAYIGLAKSGNGTKGSFDVLTTGEVLGNVFFAGDDGANLQTLGAQIRATVNGTPVTNRMPTDMAFFTAAGAADDDIAVGMTLTKAKNLNVVGGVGFYGTSAPAQATGYTTFANLTADRTLDADATTVGEVADVLGTLIVDLKATGLLAA